VQEGGREGDAKAFRLPPASGAYAAMFKPVPWAEFWNSLLFGVSIGSREENFKENWWLSEKGRLPFRERQNQALRRDRR
jgi:hypothetical protein